MRSPDPAVVRRAPFHPLLAKEMREVASGRALWTMLLILCPLVGYSFFQAAARNLAQLLGEQVMERGAPDDGWVR